MTRRTDTRHQSVFKLQDSDVTIEILEGNLIKFTVPAGSKWTSPRHWHLHTQGCHQVTCLGGRLVVSTAHDTAGRSTSGGPGTSEAFRPLDHHAWASRYRDQELIAQLEVDDQQTTLYRNTCSAVLDADRFPYLSLTHFWIRLFYSLLRWSPLAQHWLLARLLALQLQVMYTTHDFWTPHRTINAPYLWWIMHPLRPLERGPQWTFDLQWWSYNPISRVVQKTCYWVGGIFFGMRGAYPEYTPITTADTAEQPKASSHHIRAYIKS